MNPLPSHEKMLSIIESEYESLPSKYKKFIKPKLLPLKKKTLLWEYYEQTNDEPNAPFDCWVFAELSEFSNNRFVGAVYCLGGFGNMGSPWGLTWLHEEISNFGMDSGWFNNLQNLLEEWVSD